MKDKEGKREIEGKGKGRKKNTKKNKERTKKPTINRKRKK